MQVQMQMQMQRKVWLYNHIGRALCPFLCSSTGALQQSFVLQIHLTRSAHSFVMLTVTRLSPSPRSDHRMPPACMVKHPQHSSGLQAACAVSMRA